MAAKPPSYPKGQLEYWEDLIPQCKIRHDFDTSIPAEVQTDKHLVKALPCVGCKRPLIVSTFYVPAWNPTCSSCDSGSDRKREKGSVGQPQAGRTRPEHAADLTKVLVNPTFARAICPVHPDDPDHVMELKTVSHSKRHGPTVVQFVDKVPTVVQIAPGETAMHQCLRCMAVVTYSTAVTVQYMRCNEVGPTEKHFMGMTNVLGVRPDPDLDEDGKPIYYGENVDIEEDDDDADAE